MEVKRAIKTEGCFSKDVCKALSTGSTAWYTGVVPQ